MRFANLCVVFLFLILAVPGTMSGQTYTFSGTDVPLVEAMEELEGRYGFLFSYKSDIVTSLFITAEVEEEDVHTFFQQLLQGTGVEANVLEGNFVVITEVNIPGPAPGNESFVTLCGSVKSEVGEPLVGATIAIPQLKVGAWATEDGSFKFQVPRSLLSKHPVKVYYYGFIPIDLPSEELIGAGCPDIVLQEDTLIFSTPLVIEEYITDGISYESDKDVLSIRPSSIPTLPGQTDPDVLRTLQFLPGVSSPNGELSQLYIRGGTPDQNLMLWEGIPVYHTAHYFGMISGFNPYAIGQMNLYRGGFGADQGGRASGLVQMEALDGENAATRYGAGINMLHAHTQGNQLISDGKASISWSLRRSIADLWPSPTYQNITRRVQQGILIEGLDPYNLPPEISINNEMLFLDGNVTAMVDLGKVGMLTASWFGSRNDFEDNIENSLAKNAQIDSLSIRNSGASIQWKGSLGKGDFGLLVSSSDYDLVSTYTVEWEQSTKNNQSSLKTNQLAERQVRVDYSFPTPIGFSIQTGYSLNAYDVDFHVNQVVNELPLANQGNSNTALLNTGFVILRSQEGGRFRGELGIRLSHFSPNNQWYPEPRLQLTFDPSRFLTFSLQAGRYRQFLSHLLEIQGGNTGIESPIWVLSGTKEIPVIQSDQLQVGVIWEPKSWVIDVQAYWRQMDNLSSLAIGFDDGGGGQFYLGTGSARGIDFLVRKRWPNFRSWISYSLSEVLHEFPDFQPTAFWAEHDQRHQLSIVNQLLLGDLECSLAWKLNSGVPYTEAIGLRNILDPNGNLNLQPIYGEYHAERLPLQHQLDVSALYHFYGPNSLKGTIGLSILNVYNQRNLYDVALFVDQPPGMRPARLVTVEKIDLLLTPNVVLRLEF